MIDCPIECKTFEAVLRGGVQEAYGHLESYFDCHIQNREIE